MRPDAAPRSIRSKAVGILLVAAYVVLVSGCRYGPVAARQALTDPIMQFDDQDPIDPPYSQEIPISSPLPPDNINTRVDFITEPGYDARATQLDSRARFAIELFGGFGLEGGYEYLQVSQFVQKMDGISEPIKVERTSYGPNVALLMDDGVSLLRLGYRYRESWDGRLHEPELVARTNVLGDDTGLEIGYKHATSSLKIPLSRHPAKGPIDDVRKLDRIQLAVEQGFLPGWKIRWELAVELEEGFLQSPYRFVTLWPDRSPDPSPLAPPPRVEAENHPGARTRWGTRLRARRWLPSLSSVLEIGIEHGSGNWRVEHSAATLGYLLRVIDPITLSVAGGIYHQTRANFYRDIYWNGPVDSHWSADRNLCSFLATWAQVGFQWNHFGNQRRWLGLFRSLSIRLSARVVLVDYEWPGAGPNHGFTITPTLVDDRTRKFDAGLSYLGVFEFEGGF